MLKNARNSSFSGKIISKMQTRTERKFSGIKKGFKEIKSGQTLYMEKKFVSSKRGAIKQEEILTMSSMFFV